MFDSNVLDVAIGLALFFLFVSLMCSALREMGAALTRARAADLERGIRNLFGEQDGAGAVQSFFDHPRIAALFMGRYDATRLSAPTPQASMPIGERHHLPSYVPANQFSTALVDIITAGRAGGRTAAVTAAELRAAAADFSNPAIRTAVLSALDAAQDDINRAKASLEDWFNAAMDRVSGWYKQRTQVILFVIGFAAAVIFNLNALEVGKQLQTDAALRAAVVAGARVELASAPAARDNAAAADEDAAPATEEEKAAPVETAAERAAAADPAAATEQSVALDEVVGRFGAIGFSTGWSRPCPEMTWSCFTRTASNIGTWAGWLITALAVTLGAPFWFDLLNKFMSLRSAIKPEREEPTPAPAAPPPAAARSRTASAPAETPDELHEWNAGDAREGVL